MPNFPAEVVAKILLPKAWFRMSDWKPVHYTANTVTESLARCYITELWAAVNETKPIIDLIAVSRTAISVPLALALLVAWIWSIH